MATTRKSRSAAKAEGTAEAKPEVKPTVAAADLANYIGWDGDPAKLNRAVELATQAISLLTGQEMPEKLPHELAQAVRLAATKLLLTDKLDEPMPVEELPAVARYFVRLASAQG